MLQTFRPLFEDASLTKIGQNIKYDALVLRNYGIVLQGNAWDTMIAHYLIEPEAKHGMDVLSENYLGYTPVSITELIGKKGSNQGNMRDVPLEKIKEYAAEDADITWQLYKHFKKEIDQTHLHKLFYEVESPLIAVLTDMEYEGVNIDVDFLRGYSKELTEEIVEMQDKIQSECGTTFNLDSPKQLGDILFEKLKIPYAGKKTKTGQYSTDEDTLSKLEHEHAVIGHILNYRELTKLKSTYVDALPELINPKTNRLHTTYNQTIAATGRLSSINPNLQNIPIRTDRGKKIRKAFIPRDSQHVLLSVDYSQVELRIVASLSGDENMIDAFNHHLDIHAATASKVFEVPLDNVTPEMRRQAKMVNFGIIYGISAFGLAQRLGIPRGEAAKLIEQYFEKYNGIKKYMDEAIQKARETGYAETILGRRRYLRDINAGNYTIRGFAERNAINAPIQGSAADMIKVAMVNIHKKMKEQQLRSKMLLQVHDELLFDVHHSEQTVLKELVVAEMQNALTLQVPVDVSAGFGNNWLEAH
jgi:DNA polymerase I